jgi:hypothetical protein
MPTWDGQATWDDWYGIRREMVDEDLQRFVRDVRQETERRIREREQRRRAMYYGTYETYQVHDEFVIDDPAQLDRAEREFTQRQLTRGARDTYFQGTGTVADRERPAETQHERRVREYQEARDRLRGRR